MARLGLFFLGPPEILIDNRPVTFPIRKSTALVSYLSVTGKSHSRDSMATFLWPELDQTRARASLRHALWTISSAGLADWLEIDQELIGLKPGCMLDVAAFREKLVTSRTHGHPTGSACSVCIALLSEAADLYRGDFLSGFTLRDSPEFDNWQLYQAEGLRQELAEGLERLVSLSSAAGEWEQAVPIARRWVALDPLNELAHRWLMRLYAQSHKRGLIQKQYETLRQTLDRELGVEPEAETRQLYEDILAGRIPAHDQAPSIAESDVLIPTLAQSVKAAPRTNLPLPLTPLLGREQDIVAIRDSLLKPDTHLLTLTGPPGIGKTRLSIQAASELAEHFKDGVCFVPLAPVRDADLVEITINQTLRIRETGEWTPIPLNDYLRDKNILLVLDNFEHVLDAAPLVARLLQSCPGLKILATSRAPLKISGERQYPLAPLKLPDLNRLPSTETLSNYPAIALFVARASLVDPEFSLTETNAGIIAEICHHLDGLPLAIELAAAWIKLLPPPKLLARLSNRLSLLKGGSIDLPSRQRTLRAAIDWSYQLLDSWEQILLNHLTIFVGGWNLEAAGAVVGLNDLALSEAEGAEAKDGSLVDVMEGLLNLVDKSLVKRQVHTDGYERFTMLETICEYATEKLIARGEKEILQQRHAAYFLGLAESSEPALRGPQQQFWLILLMDEHNNLRAALQWALDKQEAEIALKLAGCLWRFWWMHGHINEGRAWLEKALAIPSEQNTSWRAKALNGIGILARSQGDYANARIFLEECLEIRRSLEDRAGVASVLNSLGGLALYQGDYETAYQYHEEGLAYLRETGDTRDIAVSLNNLAMVAQERSEFAQAEKLYSKSLALLNQIKDAHSIAAVLANTGALMNDRGDASKAEAFFKDSLSISKDLGRRDDIIECLEGFANAAAIHQKPHRAARLLGAAQAIRETISAPMPPYKYARYQRFMERVTTQLDQETLASELRIGKEMSLEEAIDYALNSP